MYEKEIYVIVTPEQFKTIEVIAIFRKIRIVNVAGQNNQYPKYLAFLPSRPSIVVAMENSHYANLAKKSGIPFDEFVEKIDMKNYQESAKKLLPIIQAAAEGKTIYSKDNKEKFTTFWTPDIGYKVAEEPTYRPFRDEELIALVGKTIIDKKLPSRATLIHKVNTEVEVIYYLATPYENALSPNTLLDEFVFADGSPCGVKTGTNTPRPQYKYLNVFEGSTGNRWCSVGYDTSDEADEESSRVAFNRIGRIKVELKEVWE